MTNVFRWKKKKFCYSGISFQTLSKAKQTYSTKLLISFGFFELGTGIKHHYLFHVQTRNIVDCGMNSGMAGADKKQPKKQITTSKYQMRMKNIH